MDATFLLEYGLIIYLFFLKPSFPFLCCISFTQIRLQLTLCHVHSLMKALKKRLRAINESRAQKRKVFALYFL